MINAILQDPEDTVKVNENISDKFRVKEGLPPTTTLDNTQSCTRVGN